MALPLLKKHYEIVQVIIKNHYVTFVKPTYNDTNNSLSLNPYNGDDSPMPTRVDVLLYQKQPISKRWFNGERR